MSELKRYFLVTIISGLFALLCMPTILIAEAFGYPDDYYHFPQFVACIICTIAGIKYLRLWHKSKGRNLMEETTQKQPNTVTSDKTENPVIAGPFAKSLVTMAVCLAGAWVVFGIFILILYTTCMPDF